MHNINENRMFYHGKRPWHGLGVELDHPATAKEAIEAARLDYPVKLRELYTVSPFVENGIPVDDYKAVVREDNEAILGVVGKDYSVVQNTEAFNFFDGVVGEGQAIYHTAGALGKGERIWIMAKLPDNILVTKDDVIEKFLLLTTSHDGTSSLKMYFTPVRVVCQNTLVMSLKNAKDGISIRHTGDIKTRMNEARRVLGLAVQYYMNFEDTIQGLRRYQMSAQELDMYFNYVLGKESDVKVTDMSTKMQNDRSALFTLFERGMGNDLQGIRGSAWSAFNSVTEFVDHYKTVRGTKEDPTNRLKSLWFGSGASMKIRGYEKIMEVVK